MAVKCQYIEELIATIIGFGITTAGRGSLL